ncbi:pentatricopeptide repeat-containing protein At2g22410, mitochondrial [Ricinus communis]|uniref:pentatricopeptide repeat-containing protein At2g22410, mitochondrial n=1 Tax=Ricinus communis TaxID=3988 RepID=UPI0007722865|nr:pentatricopeptide repeat-containing protein At2g22410, mitochondrial [Ricinus communis]|eukprot:XP_015573527.1 pentatricopeptide repeat-containing protein At2g22410, mitochondrial [Ricinus communis]
MKPFLFLSSPKSLVLKLLSSTTFKHQIVLYHNSVKPFSSTKTTRWNSTTNVIVTHPVLLIMESCTCMIQLKQIQAHMIITGLITHTFPVSRVLAFCALADTGDIRHAHLLFNQIEYPNTYIWNTMIRGFSNAKMPVMGLSFFWQMVRERVEMDTRSFVFALKASEQFLTALEGESIHCAIWKIGFPCALLVQNGLIHFYSVHGCLVLARKVFDETPARDVVSWTSMIDGYSTHDYYTDALKLFDSMLLSDVEPNEVTMISVLSACSQKGDLSLGKSIHEYVRRKNLNLSVNLMNAILDMYVKCGCLVAAREIFDSMGTKDVFSWTSMVNGYAKTGELEIARKFFDDMPKRNVVSWNAMIAGYSQNNQPKKAIVLFHHMVGEGLIPIENTLVCVLSACGQLGYLDLGRLIHMYHIERKQKGTSVIIANALIDMYAKCGVIDAAARVFNGMPGRDLVSWNSMIAACASHGHAKQALLMFGQMIHEGFKPDDITFVGVLSACDHGGLVTKGREYFQEMEGKFGIKPKAEHYACMIDLLGRVGLLQEASALITEMPMKPNVAAWGALLNACKMHGNVELAEIAARELLDLDPGDSGIYVSLAITCANGKRWGDVRMIRSMMRERQVKKIPGHSLIEVEGQFHEFLASDKSHPLSEDIYKTLHGIYSLSKLVDYVPKTSGMIHLFLFSENCSTSYA